MISIVKSQELISLPVVFCANLFFGEYWANLYSQYGLLNTEEDVK